MNKYNQKNLNKSFLHLFLLIFLLVNFRTSKATNLMIASGFENISKTSFKSTHNQIDTIKLKRVKKSKDVLKELPKIITNITTAETFTVSYKKVKFLIVAINSKYNELKISNNSTGKLQGLDYHYMQNPNATILMNAGMYEADGSSVGLLIANNKVIKKVNLKTNLPGNFYSMSNAIFFIDKNANYNVKSTSLFQAEFKNKYEQISFATQSGPVLNIEGKINKEFNIKSTNRLIRNGIGVINNAKNNICVLIISQSPTTFYELASLFKYLGCQNAMYLDGTVSSVFCRDKKNKKDKPKSGGVKLGPVIVVIPKELSKRN